MKQLIGRLRRDDDGSALVMVLVVITAIGITMTAVLSFAGTALTVTPQVRDDRNETHYVSGAVQGAINEIRNSALVGTDGINCPDFDPTNGAVDGATGSFHVTCDPRDTSNGEFQDQPRWAIQTLGTANGEGLNIVQGNNLLTVDGGVYSHGRINVSGGSGPTLQVVGSAYAEGPCSPMDRMTTTDLDGMQCDGDYGDDIKAFGADPDYKSSVPDNAALTDLIQNVGADPAPTCTSSGVLRFSPGYYSETPDRLRQTFAPLCSAEVWLFDPGTYYFDYQGTWTFDTVVAGKPSPATGGWLASGDESDLDGSDCDADLESPDNQAGLPDGVQFIFAGGSKVEESTSTSKKHWFEICGPHKGDSFGGNGQHIAIFGQNVGSAGSGQTETLTADQVPTNTGNTNFTPTANAQTIDGSSATATAMSSNNASNTAKLNYSSFTNLTKGTRVGAVNLRVRATVPNRTSASVLVKSDSTPAGTSFNVNNCNPDCTINISSAFKAPLWKDINSMTVDYTSTAAGNYGGSPKPTINGIDVSVTHTSPQLQRLICNASPCVFFDASNPHASILVHGTVYTPDGGWDLTVQGSESASGDRVIFDRGVVMRTLDVTPNSSFAQTTAPFQLPKGGPFTRKVLFTGFSGAVPIVRACVEYQDFATLPNGTRGPAFPGFRVDVQRWNVAQGDDGVVIPSC